jgi:hypothetical protein
MGHKHGVALSERGPHRPGLHSDGSMPGGAVKRSGHHPHTDHGREDTGEGLSAPMTMEQRSEKDNARRDAQTRALMQGLAMADASIPTEHGGGSYVGSGDQHGL